MEVNVNKVINGVMNNSKVRGVAVSDKSGLLLGAAGEATTANTGILTALIDLAKKLEPGAGNPTVVLENNTNQCVVQESLASCLIVGLLWGVTNVLIKRFTTGINRVTSSDKELDGILRFLNDLAYLVTNWKYLLSFLFNQLGSLLFYFVLVKTDISFAIPVTNSLTFIVTGITGCLLGEEVPSKSCCGCCAALRPRYKRLVDNIFPVLPHDGLVKSNMDKLIFYAVSSPEKLDRIGEYLYQKAGRDIYRRRYKFAIMAMEAMDQLLIACHAQTLNLFVESFLKMVQKLLESTEAELQIMATHSFVRFANIEEDTPSYHLRYDFFVSKFSSMCHNNDDNITVRDNLRLAGIKGLQGVVRKTVSDDLVENIWDSVHMDKIVPSLLYNMHTSSIGTLSRSDASSSGAKTEDDTDNTPPLLAKSCLRELVGRASFGHIRSVLRPVLRHLDNHSLWLPNSFAVETFTLITYSVQTQYSCTVVEMLMSHLDENLDAKIRTSIADVLSKIIAIAANESVGPSVLEIINSLLNHLRTSVSSPGRQSFSVGHQQETSSTIADEQLYQEALINALGEFTNHLPDYQKIEIMMFIMGKVRYLSKAGRHSSDVYDSAYELLLENILLKSLLKVSSKYKTAHFNTTFPTSFLEPLLQLSLAPDPEMRITVQNIFHTLIDRNGNLSKLLKPTIAVRSLGLRMGKCSRSDMIFIRKHGPEIFTALYESLELINNTEENVNSIYTTMALLTLELVSEETMIDVIRLLLSVQDMTLTSTCLSNSQKASLHAIVISVFALIPWVVGISTLQEYADTLIANRRAAGCLLPDEELPSKAHTPDESLLLQLDAIIACLQHAGHDVQRMLNAPGYVALTHRHSWVDSGLSAGTPSAVDSTAANDVDSIASSPGLQKRQIEEALTFDSMKKILTETAEARKVIEDERRTRINEFFQTASFQELLQHNLRQNEDILGTKLAKVFTKISQKEAGSPVNDSRKSITNSYEIYFPELLFIY